MTRFRCRETEEIEVLRPGWGEVLILRRRVQRYVARDGGVRKGRRAVLRIRLLDIGHGMRSFVLESGRGEVGVG